MTQQDYYWYWLNNIPGIGRKTIRKLLQEYRTPEQIYLAGENQVDHFLRHDSQKNAFHLSKDEEVITNSYHQLADKGIRFLHPGLQEYPERLRKIPDSPTGLYVKGLLPESERRSVAIIGARDCTRYGSEIAHFFGRELSANGVAVVSGLARGIDGMAHRGALDAGGYTLGVLGCGIDQVYPEENYPLFMQMEQTGGIISESNMGVPPTAGLFPERNRLIAGMSDGILVVEAKEKSGTFITVDQGLEQGKEIFAIPGRVLDAKSAGCNHLIKFGAHIVTEVRDILEILHLDNKIIEKQNDLNQEEIYIKKISLAPIEKMVYSCLRIEPKYLDEIIGETCIAPQEVCIALNQLVVSGIIAETSSNYYAIRL